VLGPASGSNAVVARGQSIDLPKGEFSRLYLLAAADGDRKAAFRIDGKPVELTVQDWTGFIGQWDNRTWNVREEPVPPQADRLPGGPGSKPLPPRTRTVMDYTGLTPGYVKPAAVAWFASHRHLADGTNDPYMYSYLFAYVLDIPAGAKTLTFPDDPKVRIMAVTLSDVPWPAKPVQPLFDTLVR
jgi:alpha-mannosidase